MLIFWGKAYGGPRPLPLAYAVYAFINVDNCERPLTKFLVQPVAISHTEAGHIEHTIIQHNFLVYCHLQTTFMRRNCRFETSTALEAC